MKHPRDPTNRSPRELFKDSLNQRDPTRLRDSQKGRTKLHRPDKGNSARIVDLAVTVLLLRSLIRGNRQDKTTRDRNRQGTSKLLRDRTVLLNSRTATTHHQMVMGTKRLKNSNRLNIMHRLNSR